MRMFRDFVVNPSHTAVDVLVDKLAFVDLLLQNLFDLGFFCQRIESFLDTRAVQDVNLVVQRGLVSVTLYD
jgi:hypothetical protein